MIHPTVQVGARIPENLYRYLKGIARKQAYLQGRDVTLADLIRETLAEQYPVENEEPEEPKLKKDGTGLLQNG